MLLKQREDLGPDRHGQAGRVIDGVPAGEEEGVSDLTLTAEFLHDSAVEFAERDPEVVDE